MKQILLTLAFAAFTVAAQAGETKNAKTTDTEKSSCAEKSSCCSQSKTEQTKAGDDSKSACCAAKTKSTSVKQALLSPKAAGEVTKKL